MFYSQVLTRKYLVHLLAFFIQLFHVQYNLTSLYTWDVPSCEIARATSYSPFPSLLLALLSHLSALL